MKNNLHFRQAIQTTYIGPTDFRGARVSVRAQAGRRLVPWDHALGIEENHYQAARGFAESMGWLAVRHYDGKPVQARLEGGCLPSGAYCFVLVDEKNT